MGSVDEKGAAQGSGRVASSESALEALPKSTSNPDVATSRSSPSLGIGDRAKRRNQSGEAPSKLGCRNRQVVPHAVSVPGGNVDQPLRAGQKGDTDPGCDDEQRPSPALSLVQPGDRAGLPALQSVIPSIVDSSSRATSTLVEGAGT